MDWHAVICYFVLMQAKLRLEMEMERLRHTHCKEIESKDDEVEEIRQSCSKKVTQVPFTLRYLCSYPHFIIISGGKQNLGVRSVEEVQFARSDSVIHTLLEVPGFPDKCPSLVQHSVQNKKTQ